MVLPCENGYVEVIYGHYVCLMNTPNGDQVTRFTCWSELSKNDVECLNSMIESIERTTSNCVSKVFR